MSKVNNKSPETAIRMMSLSEDETSMMSFMLDKLGKHPHESELRINKMANNAKYLPISYVESQLDMTYYGLWNVKDFTTQVVSNEIVGSIQLEVFHPIGKVWITRTGAAAVMIQTKKGMESTPENKIKNTLVKDYPHLLSECIKNAAKKLGNAFGRNINRDDVKDYDLNEMTKGVVGQMEFEAIVDKIAECQSMDALSQLWHSLDQTAKSSTLVLAAFSSTKRQLK